MAENKYILDFVPKQLEINKEFLGTIKIQLDIDLLKEDYSFGITSYDYLRFRLYEEKDGKEIKTIKQKTLGNIPSITEKMIEVKLQDVKFMPLVDRDYKLELEYFSLTEDDQIIDNAFLSITKPTREQLIEQRLKDKNSDIPLEEGFDKNAPAFQGQEFLWLIKLLENELERRQGNYIQYPHYPEPLTFETEEEVNQFLQKNENKGLSIYDFTEKLQKLPIGHEYIALVDSVLQINDTFNKNGILTQYYPSEETEGAPQQYMLIELETLIKKIKELAAIALDEQENTGCRGGCFGLCLNYCYSSSGG